MSKVCLNLLALLVALSAWGRPGTVQTLTGQQFSGDILFAHRALTITTQGQVKEIPLSDLWHLRFDERAANSEPTDAAGGLLGCYFAHTNVAGKVLVRLDPTLDFDWGATTPIPGLGRDDFSVIWMGELEAPATGSFTFTLETDDGVRLFVANTLLGESWTRQESGEISGTVSLEAGQRYPLMVFYYNGYGNAHVRLFWSGPGMPKSIVPKQRLHPKSLLLEHPADIASGQGLLATYYQNADLSGTTFTRVDPKVDCRWADRAPAPGIAPTNCSIRWTGQLTAEHSETYTFYLATDKAARLWINNQLVIDQQQPSSFRELKADLALVAGAPCDLRLETRNSAAPASVRLLWSSPSVPKSVIPAARLSPAQSPQVRQPKTQPAVVSPPGILLRNGSFIARPVAQASDTAIEIDSWGSQPVSLVNVAQIICQPLTESLATRLQGSRPGVLLASGDFEEGEFKALTNGQVQVSSVLFGLRTYELSKDVAAIALHEPAPTPGRFSIRLQDQSLLLVNQVQIAEHSLMVQDELLGRLTIPAGEIAQLQRSLSAAQR